MPTLTDGQIKNAIKRVAKSKKTETLEGTHSANRGDYIIQGVKGELYPCKPDIFEMTYEEVTD